MQSNLNISSQSSSSPLSSTMQKSLAEDSPKTVDFTHTELVKTHRSFNIEEIKQSLLNPKDGTIINTDDASLKDNDSREPIRKRSNTWPIKKVDFNASTNDYEKIFAEKMIKELGIDNGKQLKNPWGNLSYSQLIEKAIECSPWKSLSLKEIYSWFTKYVPFFKDKSNYKSTMGWKVGVFVLMKNYFNLSLFLFKNSIRHNLSLHKRFIRVAIFQRNHHSNNRSPSKPMKFVWTSLKYKPKNHSKTTTSNQTASDQMKQQEFLFYQNAAIFNNNQNLINLQNYSLNQCQLIDPNQMIQFYRILNNPMFLSNIINQIPKNVENTENENCETNHTNYKRLINNDCKCSCSACTTQIANNLQQQQAIWQAHFKEQQEAQIRYPISLALNSASSLLTIAPGFQHELTNPLRTAPTDEENPSNNNKRKRIQRDETSPFNLEESTNEEIVVDYDDSSSNDSKSRNDQASYNFKRKLIDRYIATDNYISDDDDDSGSLKRQKVDDSKNLESFLKTNAISSNLLKYTDTSSSYNTNNQNTNLQLSQLIGNNISIDTNTCNNNSSTNHHQSFGLLKKILNKKN